MIKSLFFDVDGTLVSFKTHKIPERTIQVEKQCFYHDCKFTIFFSFLKIFSHIYGPAPVFELSIPMVIKR